MKTDGAPDIIITDKNPAYGAAPDAMKKSGKCQVDVEHRQVKYLNNRLEADHGKLKRLTKPVGGFSFGVMRMFRRGQMRAWRRLPGVKGEVYLIEKQFGIHSPAFVQEEFDIFTALLEAAAKEIA